VARTLGTNAQITRLTKLRRRLDCCHSLQSAPDGMARSWLLSADERRALVMLASSPGGATMALLLRYGFTRKTITALVRAGLATVTPDEVVRADGRIIDVGLVKITQTGRRALAD